MPDLLLELLSEEIPARMQARAAEDLRKLITDRLVAAGLTYEGAKAYATPRRLALAVHGIPLRQPDVREEKKGPRVGAPEAAIAGFLKSAGLKSIQDARIENDAKKGDFYLAVIEKPGRPAIEVIAEIVPEVVRSFPWPKSMRWGAQSARGGAFDSSAVDSSAFDTGSLRWVRPLHSIVATFGPETEAPAIVPFEVDGIKAGDVTRGHRFLAPEPFQVRRFADYVAKLAKAKVVLDGARRQEVILADAKNLAFAQGFELVEDAGLLAEVAGLVEWPVVHIGTFDAAFLAIPGEVIRATIRNNQKCFVLRDPQTAKLVNKFILVANTEASDGGSAIVAGNERVIRARLADAKFFYDTDLKTKLEDRLPKFGGIVFHEKLGTQGERIARIERLADEIAVTLSNSRPDFFHGKLLSADEFQREQDAYRTKAKRAARLCKADLLTEMVGEFPELQGLMGKYYAEAQGEDEAVAHAIEDHYKPKGPDDLVPGDRVSVAVALADKFDTLVGFWAIDEKPTGSKDPYALRRAALGVIRLVLDNRLRIKLSEIYSTALLNLISQSTAIETEVIRILSGKNIAFYEWYELAKEKPISCVLNHDGLMDNFFDLIEKNDPIPTSRTELLLILPILKERAESLDAFLSAVDISTGKKHKDKIEDDLADALHAALPAMRRSLQPALDKFSKERLNFDADRLKVQLREQGARHDLVDAVFALEGQDDLLLIVRRVEALGKFLDSDDGKNLLAGTKRAANILRIEEKKDNKPYSGAPDAKLYQQDEERALAQAIDTAKKDAAAAVAKEDFAAAMSAMARLRPRVDAFFDKVTVNADDAKLRENRLKLLNEIRAATRTVADFSKIEG